MSDEEDSIIKLGSFWTTGRIILILVFLLGVIIGGVIVNQYIDPFIYANQVSDFNSVSALNNRLDTRADELYNCLLENDVSPTLCNISSAEPAVQTDATKSELDETDANETDANETGENAS